jgi:putative ABC transport system substrate-binding protein
MRRREFITVFGGAAVTWPFAARAATAGKLPVIGIIMSGTPERFPAYREDTAALLSEFGWIEGRMLL